MDYLIQMENRLLRQPLDSESELGRNNKSKIGLIKVIRTALNL